MTIINCYTCDAHLEASDSTPSELAAQNNWLPVKIEGIEGFLYEQCSKWIDSPIRIWRDRMPEYFEIRKRPLHTYELTA